MPRPRPATPESYRAASPVLVLPVSFAGDDVALVAALKEGRPGARAELFNRYARTIERVITHVIGYDSELDDVLQQTFANALGSIQQLQDPAALKPWLIRIATLTARKLLRGRGRRGWLRFFLDADDEARHEPVAANTSLELVHSVRAVYGLLDRLPTDERLAFALRYIEGMQLPEVAEACAISLSTVKRRLARAEERFIRSARKDPLLSDWLERGSRWKSP